MLLLVIAISFPLIIALLLALMVGGSLYAPRAFAASTSPLGAAIAVEGVVIQSGNGASPEVFTTIANVSDITLPLSAKTVDVTNVSNLWMAEIPTLLQYGKMSIKIFWVMEETTHRNSASSTVRGLRYLMFNRILTDFQIIYADGSNSTDAFSAYVTSVSNAAKVAGVWESTVELSGNDQTPSFV